MIKAIFFDLDGTLVDTHKANYVAYNKALNDFGFDISYEEFQKSIGHQARTFLPWFAPGLREQDYEEMAAKKATYYKTTISESVANVRLINHLQYLKEYHKIVLVTTAKKGNAIAVLQHHGIEEYFDHIVTAEDVSSSKPSPECYELALKICGIKPTEALAFEDSKPGLDAAEGAGIPVIIINDFTI